MDAFKGCNCTASAATPGFCTNLNYCPLPNCNGTLDPGSTDWGKCSSGPERGCICANTTPGGTTTISSVPPTPTPTGGFWLAYETNGDEYSLLLVPDAYNNCANELDKLYYVNPYDSSGNSISSNWIELLTSPPSGGFSLTNSVNIEGISSTNSMCFIKGLEIMFIPTSYGFSKNIS
jgi:hypothetical protein